MIWAMALVLAVVLAGLPLTVAATTVTASVAGVVLILALAGLSTRCAGPLTAAASLGLVEELTAVVSAGTSPDFWRPLLLGIAIYLLLEAGAVMRDFRGVTVDPGVYRMKAAHWGRIVFLSVLVALMAGLPAAVFAHLGIAPLPFCLLSAAGACAAVGAAVAAVRVWRQGPG